MDNQKSKKYFWILLDVLIAGLVINLFFFIMPAIDRVGNSQPAIRTITVNADGKTAVKPDLAEFSFSILTEGADLAKITAENNKRVEEVLKFIKSEGVPEDDIKTSQYNLQPKYQYSETQKRSYIIGYELNQGISVKVKNLQENLDKVSNILGSLPELGVNNISGVNFTVEDPDKFMNVAREEAYEKARKQAEFMAKASGAKLGKVIYVSEYQNGPIPYYRDYYAKGMGGEMAVAAPSVSAPIQTGTDELTLQVNITYELR